jgi:glycerol-1-phosphate dehydrogenase [NAD(P)+]
VAVGPGQGDAIAAGLDLDAAELFRIPDGSHAAAVSLGKRLRAGQYEAVAGIGGGKTIDVTKFAANMAGIPMVSVPTSLAHDGICSPVATLEHESGKGSYGVVMPVAVIVDPDRIRLAPDPLATAGIGDVVSNLSAMADWELAAADTGEQVDGLAAAMARSAAHAVLRQPGPARSDEFLTVLAEALVLSGIAMSVAGSSRPASGGDHEARPTRSPPAWTGTACPAAPATSACPRPSSPRRSRMRRPCGRAGTRSWSGLLCPTRR